MRVDFSCDYTQTLSHPWCFFCIHRILHRLSSAVLGMFSIGRWVLNRRGRVIPSNSSGLWNSNIVVSTAVGLCSALPWTTIHAISTNQWVPVNEKRKKHRVLRLVYAPLNEIKVFITFSNSRTLHFEYRKIFLLLFTIFSFLYFVIFMHLAYKVLNRIVRPSVNPPVRLLVRNSVPLI